MADVIQSTSEADLLATEEMIRNLRAGRLRNLAIGLGAAGALLMIGGSAMIWAARQGNDPEALKEALKNMPPLAITVKVDPESKIGLAEGGKVELADGGTVALEPGAKVTVRGTVKQEGVSPLPQVTPSEDQSVLTEVTVFKTVRYGQGLIVTGWVYATGNSKSPKSQFCYHQLPNGDGTSRREDIAKDRSIVKPALVAQEEQNTRFLSCQWFSGV